MSLQNFVYGTMRPDENNAFIGTHIFPDPNCHSCTRSLRP